MFIVFDLETTGFDRNICDIIQMSYIAFDDNFKFVRAEQLHFYYKGMSWSEEAYEVHKIPLNFLEQYEDDFEGNVCKMYAILKNAFVITYNGKMFDGPFVTTWLERMGISGLTFSGHMDMMIEYKPIYKRARISLVNLCKMLEFTPAKITEKMNEYFAGVGKNEAHDSAYDTTATTMLLFNAMNTGLISNGSNVDTAAAYVPDSDILSAGKELDPDGVIVFTKDGMHYLTQNPDTYAGVDVVYESILRDRLAANKVLPCVFDENKMFSIVEKDYNFRLCGSVVTYSSGIVQDLPMQGTSFSNITKASFPNKLQKLREICEDSKLRGIDFIDAVSNCVRGVNYV